MVHDATFELNRGQVSERRMPAAAIVKQLDVFEHRAVRIGSSTPLAVWYTSSSLSVAKKLSATALSQQFPRRLMLLRCRAAQHLLIFLAGVLAAAVGVMQ